MRRQLALPCDSVGFLRPVAVAEGVSEHFLVRGSFIITIVRASARPVVDLASSLWFVFSRRLAPSRRRLAFRAALLCYPSFYSIALVVEALELAAERFRVLTFVDVHGCCALQLAALGAEYRALVAKLVWGFYAPSADPVFGAERAMALSELKSSS